MKKQNEIDFYNIPIVDYLLMIGEPIESIGRNYFQHIEHDSLKINQRKNYFVWNSRSSEKNSKGGVVQYLQIVHGLTLKQALVKIENDLLNTDLKAHKQPQKDYPKNFNYRVKEKFTILEAQKYLVTQRKISNKIVRKFYKEDFISQNNSGEIIFKWKKGNEKEYNIVGFSKQGTVKLTEEQKAKYHTKRDYMKYVAPTTEEHTYWGFNYLKGNPERLFFFESPIDLLSYYTIHEDKLTNDVWLISIDGLSIEKVFNFLKYGIENMDLTTYLKKISICFDNDDSGIKAYKELSKRMVNGIEFTKDFPIYNDWNEELQKLKEGTKNDKNNNNQYR